MSTSSRAADEASYDCIASPEPRPQIFPAIGRQGYAGRPGSMLLVADFLTTWFIVTDLLKRVYDVVVFPFVVRDEDQVRIC